MNFDFTEEQEIFRKSLREYLAKNLVPRLMEMREERTVTPEVHKALVDYGLYGLVLPKEYGGSEADWITFTIAAEEAIHADAGASWGFGAWWWTANCSRLIANHGTDQLKEEVLPNVVEKGWNTSLHSTEPGCGTDFTRITTTAEKQGSEYIVNGEKQCVSLALETKNFGGGFLTTVNTNHQFRQRARGMSLLYIPVTSDGITITNFEGMGVDIGGVKYDGTRVPEHCLVGAEGMGAPLALECFIHARVPVTMVLVASAERCLEDGIEYLKQRKAFNRPIGGFEGPQFELAGDYARVQAAKLLCYRAAWMVDRYHQGKALLEDCALAPRLRRSWLRRIA